MNTHSETVRQNLISLIGEMSQNQWLFVKNPGKDFTRNRKLSFETVVLLLISMGGNSIVKELLEASGYDLNTATASAFVQQRDKILPWALEFLFQEFTQSLPLTKKHKGYKLLAVDGSDVRIPTNLSDTDTHYPNGYDGYNLLHLNALYDLEEKLYLDAFIQPSRKENENKALISMVDRSTIDDNVILIADRGYESYNNFAHIERKGWKYLIRVKDLGRSGILSGLKLPDSQEFDVCVQRILTRKQTKEVKERPDLYKLISSKSPFDFLDLNTNKFYPISFRVLRFKISDSSFETVITNLDKTEFSSEEIKSLYYRRWGIETSFRQLKYSVGLLAFHSKKREYIIQEIFARMIMYNFSQMITENVVISKADTRYSYQINLAVAIQLCRKFLQSPDNIPPPGIEALIAKNTTPLRPGRKAKRKARDKTAIGFNYRIA